jgi:peptidoglycan/LPS O-acetylase OafA/YrhL
VAVGKTDALQPEDFDAGGRPRLPGLDGLRAAAVGALLAGRLLPRLGVSFPLAQAGLCLSFVLSGFLVTRGLLLDREDDAGGGRCWARVRRFYARRCLRVGPVYFLVVALTAACFAEQARDVLPWLATGTLNVYMARTADWLPGLGHLWTVAVVVQIWLLWPWLVLGLPRRALLPALALVMAAGPLYRWWAAGALNPVAAACLPPEWVDVFGAGAVLAAAAHPGGARAPAGKWLGPLLLLGGAAAAVWLDALSTGESARVPAALENVALAVACAGAVVAAAGGAVGAVLGLAPLRYLGHISYALYVYYAFVPYLADHLWPSGPAEAEYAGSEPGLGGLAAGAAAALAAAVLSWHALERPLRAPAPAPRAAARRLAWYGGLLTLILLAGGVGLVYGRVGQYFHERRARDRAAAGAAAEYYVSPSGDDGNAGTSPGAAWRTLARVNGRAFGPGDRILLQGGQTFRGGLTFGRDSGGTPDDPVTVESYGAGRAVLDAGDGDGVRVENTAGICVRGLEVVGSGQAANRGSGIAFRNDLPGGVKLAHVRVEDVEVRGFGRYGVYVGAERGKSGFRDVRVTGVAAHDNGLAGVYVRGRFTQLASGYAHEDVYVRDCRAYANTGVAGSDRENSGSGIVLSDVDGGVVERCVAYGNGALCDALQGGPVGIWAWDARRVTIQHNESYGNRVAGEKDGGGFDLDGGVCDSVLQYNYSHDNDGAGYLLAQFPGARPFAGNTVRFNVSENDGRRNGYAGIQVWGPVRDSAVYHNTVYVSPAAEGRPAALRFNRDETDTAGVRVLNNVLVAAAGLPLVDVPRRQDGLLFLGNAYHAPGGDFRVEWLGEAYAGLGAWRAAAGQERLGGRDVGLAADPRLRAPGAGGTLGDARRLESLDAYRQRDGSPLAGAGVDPRRDGGLDPGPHDYYGNPLPAGGAPDVGAHQRARP